MNLPYSPKSDEKLSHTFLSMGPVMLYFSLNNELASVPTMAEEEGHSLVNAYILVYKIVVVDSFKGGP